MIYKIEKAKSKDSYFLYKIRNLDDIRKLSSNTSKIELQNHNKWFNRKLKLKGNFFYILKINAKKIGYIRLENKFKKYYISIALLGKYRSKGIGSKFLNIIDKKFKNKTIISEIVKKNLSSFYFFKKNGYIKFRTTKKSFFMRKTNNYKKYLKIINQISAVREKNNNNWMDILKIAFKASPKESAEIMKRIFKQDKKISKLSEKLTLK